MSVNKDIINININVPSHISLLELGKRLAINLILPETSRIAFASVSEGKIMKKLQLELCYNKTSKSEVLCAYEYEVVQSAEEYYPLEVRFQISGLKSSFKYPLLMNLPVTCTIGDVKTEILKHFLEYIKSPNDPFKIEDQIGRAHV